VLVAESQLTYVYGQFLLEVNLTQLLNRVRPIEEAVLDLGVIVGEGRQDVLGKNPISPENVLHEIRVGVGRWKTTCVGLVTVTLFIPPIIP